jgi:hypothetical protein
MKEFPQAAKGIPAEAASRDSITLSRIHWKTVPSRRPVFLFLRPFPTMESMRKYSKQCLIRAACGTHKTGPEVNHAGAFQHRVYYSHCHRRQVGETRSNHGKDPIRRAEAGQGGQEITGTQERILQ